MLSWFVAFLPCGIILFIITPLLAYWIYPPEIKGSEEVLEWSREKYKSLGKITPSQITMIVISLIGLVLWVGSSFFEIDATTTALIMIILMIMTKIIDWQDFLGNKPAWNTLVWFATLVAMASGLKNVGFLDWLANLLDGKLDSITPTIAMLILLLFFSWLRYFLLQVQRML